MRKRDRVCYRSTPLLPQPEMPFQGWPVSMSEVPLSLRVVLTGTKNGNVVAVLPIGHNERRRVGALSIITARTRRGSTSAPRFVVSLDYSPICASMGGHLSFHGAAAS